MLILLTKGIWVLYTFIAHVCTCLGFHILIAHVCKNQAVANLLVVQ